VPSFSVKPQPALTVLAACLGKGPERALLVEMGAHDAGLALTFVESRVALIRHARAIRPRVVLLPVRDTSGVPSAPLIMRLREQAPNVRILILVMPEASQAGLAEAIRAGGEATVLGGEAELRSVLYRTNDPGLLSAREYDATHALIAGLRPAELREALLFCVGNAHRQLSVADVAKSRGTSARALGRQARAGHWPTVTELIDWGRLLRASVLQWRESSGLAALAHASGFSSTQALQQAGVRLLHRSIERPGDLSPLLVSSRVHWRVQRLARPELS
jgi:AraC-like DNA-binding protein